MQTAWDDYNKLVSKVTGEYKINDDAILNDYSIIMAEYYVMNIITIIHSIRDFLKDKFIQTKIVNSHKQITNLLVKKYHEMQPKYEKLLSETINVDNCYKWIDALRNRMLHGGILIFAFDGHKISKPNYAGGYDMKHKVNLICDFGQLENSRSFDRLPLDKYHTDQTLTYLKYINSKEADWHWISEPLQKIIISNICRRLDLDQIDTKTLNIHGLLEDKDFILQQYKYWKSNNIPTLGQFSFEIGRLIKELYYRYMKFYSDFYNIILQEEHELISSLFLMDKRMEELSYKYPEQIVYNKLNHDFLIPEFYDK